MRIRYFIFLLLCASQTLVSTALFAADYWVAPISLGEGTLSTEPMSYAEFSSTTFSPGDVITFVSEHGEFNHPLHFEGNKISGVKDNPIIVKGDGDTIINVGCCSPVNGIRVTNANHLRLEKLSVIGSGGAAAVYFSNSGGSDQGFTVTGIDLEIISNNENDWGNHDGIAVDNNSEIYLIKPIVRSTRSPTGDNRSHQSITAHVNGHAIIEDADFSDTNFWAVPVDSSTITFYGGTFTNSHVGSFEIGGNGEASSFIKVLHSEAHPVYIEMHNVRGPKSSSIVSNQASVEIDGGEIRITGNDSLQQTANLGRVTISNTQGLIIDSGAWRYLGEHGSSLTLVDNRNVQLDRANGYFFRAVDGASINISRNTIINRSGRPFIYADVGTNDKIEVIANNFIEVGTPERLIWLGLQTQGEIKIHNNNFSNGDQVIEFRDFYPNASVINNNFTDVNAAILGSMPATIQHNNFYNTPALGDNAFNVDGTNPTTLIGLGLTWWLDAPQGIDGIAFSEPANIGPYANPSAVTNGKPIARNDDLILFQRSLLSGNLFDNNGHGFDFDPDSHSFHIESINGVELENGEITLASGAELTINGQGLFSYDATNTDYFDDLDTIFKKTESITYEISDVFGAIDTAVATFTVTDINSPPDAIGVPAEITAPLYNETTFSFLVTDVENHDINATLTPEGIGHIDASGTSVTARITPRFEDRSIENIIIELIDNGAPNEKTFIEIPLVITPRPDKHQEGLALYYNFANFYEGLVPDTSNASPKIDLQIKDIDSGEVTEDGFRVTQPSAFQAVTSLNELVDSLTLSNELTLEVWITPDSASMTGQASVFRFSRNNSKRNLSIDQYINTDDTSFFNGRIRTNTSSSSGASLNSNSENHSQLTQITLVKTVDNSAQLYVNGELHNTFEDTGDIANWDNSFGLYIANQRKETSPWLGTIHSLSLYDKALSPTQISQNYSAGPFLVNTPVSVPLSNLGILILGALLALGSWWSKHRCMDF